MKRTQWMMRWLYPAAFAIGWIGFVGPIDDAAAQGRGGGRGGAVHAGHRGGGRQAGLGADGEDPGFLASDAQQGAIGRAPGQGRPRGAGA